MYDKTDCKFTMTLWTLAYKYYPGIFPLVRHGDHVPVEEVPPLCIPTARRGPLCRWWGLLRIALLPVLHHVVVELLAPQQASVRLSGHQPFLVTLVLDDLRRGHNNNNNLFVIIIIIYL